MELFTTVIEAQLLIKNWRRVYNQIRPHSALGYRPPALEALMPGYGSTNLARLYHPHVRNLGLGQCWRGQELSESV